MRPWTIRAALFGAAIATAISCSGDGPTAPEQRTFFGQPQPLVVGSGPVVRIAEFHYDNAGTDAGESIEISGPAGTDLTGWSVVLYNGSNAAAAATYNTRALTGTIPTTCNERGVVVLAYPQDGLQNGTADGIALVNASGVVVELLSYEGVLTASNGPAAGMVSVDVGAAQTTTTPVGASVQRGPDGVWASTGVNSFGSCNDGDENPGEAVVVDSVEVTPDEAIIAFGASQTFSASAFDASGAAIAGAPITWSSTDEAIATVSTSGLVTGVGEGNALVIATAASGAADTAYITVDPSTTVLPPVRFSEIHYDNFDADINEGIEVEGPTGTDLTGWRIILYNGNGGLAYSTSTLTGVVTEQCEGRGTQFVSYPSNGIQNGSPDGFALVDAAGTVVEFLSYEGPMTATDGPAAGMTATDIGVSQTSAPVGTSLQRTAAGTWVSAPTNFGFCFGEAPPPPANSIVFSGRDAGDPPLPVGFEDQLFASLRSGANGSTIASTFTWVSETPLLASVDANGVVRALGTGTMIVRATAADGTTSTFALQGTVATPSSTAAYGNNTEFGDPTDGDASDEVIIRRAQYTSSFSPSRGIPNWVSYDLDATHFGAQDRCDCFTYDPELPAAGRYTTADYTGAGAVAGYGIDRGHLARSFDRTSGDFDNASTFYFSNIIPQAADNNQGPWAQFENHLGDLARFSDREVYIIAGASGNKGTVKNEGRITIPTVTWKVALVLPRDAGIGSIDSYDDAQVLAVVMPNDAGIRNVAWESYLVTVDSVEAVSGFDLLSALRDDIEIAIESNSVPPQAVLNGPWSAYHGDDIVFSAAGSTDGDGDALSYAWHFGDGTTGTGATVSHAYSKPGNFTVRLIVTDVRGLADTVEAVSTVTLFPPLVGIERLRTEIDALVATGRLQQSVGVALKSKLTAAAKAIERRKGASARALLTAVISDVGLLLSTGKLTEAEAISLKVLLFRTRDSVRD